ncbi:MAG: class I tRNA ligase family protein [Sphingobacteriales bacterium JAD_PAG50586_3]|nr:MAG: class I tRNA ligase family protein [Sphingobacteriales bacterium JAD_PAG50586_3]
MVIAPEHELVAKITTPEQKEAVEAYVNIAKNRSERERMTEVKRVSGEFTGAYVEHPFTGAPIPVWIGDYVLAGYGTGAVMAVPAGDERDYAFAKHFNLPIPAILEGVDISEAANPTKDAKMINSDFLNGLTGHEAIKKAIEEIEKKGIGKGKVNFRLRDAGYSRQRYWGEPFPVVYDKEGTPHLLDENNLPVELPKVDSYKPSGSGESPLANAKDWVNNIEGFTRETDTMPGYAGSSWYFLRYMDPKNDTAFVGKDAVEYWRSVDLYLGGSEHAVGHLLYSRMWNKFLFDLGLVVEDEPFKKLINQGMIQGRSSFVYRATFSITMPHYEKGPVRPPTAFPFIYVSQQLVEPIENGTINDETKKEIIEKFFVRYEELNGYKPAEVVLENRVDKLHCNVNSVKDDLLNTDKFLNDELIRDYKDWVDFVLVENKYLCGWEVEKMSKSKYNVVNPDDIINEFGADTLRMYEMFLGPLEQSKPWNTNGISGVHNFLRRYWRLTHNEQGFNLSEDAATKEELKVLHKTIKKVQDDIERFSFNTAVSSFMICVNELSDLKCNKRAIIEPLTALLSPFAPHIAEEVWNKLGHAESVITASFPQYNAEYTVDDAFAYPIQFNGKMKFNVEVPLNISKEEIEKLILADEKVQKQLAGAAPKKVIVVPGKIVNIVA